NFLIVAPKPLVATTLEETLKEIYNSNLYISRGDNSGTHKQELKLFKNYLDDVKPLQYLETGNGMFDTLQVANEKRGYTLCDYGTWLSYEKELDLEIVFYDENEMVNEYAIHVVSSDKVKNAKEQEAQAFVTWLESDQIMEYLKNYGINKYNKPLFKVVV
ncbi:MAG: substrate-binding domain-containing protein, partial [Bacilli bacterium]